MKVKLGVLGPHSTSEREYRLGVELGEEIARAGAVLLCGGLDGMMEAAAKGVRQAGGESIGLLPGDGLEGVNPYIDTAIPTGLGMYRNALLVRACDAVIAVRGAYGTLSEIAFALRAKVPVVGLETWVLLRDGEVDPGINLAETPREAVALALSLARR